MKPRLVDWALFLFVTVEFVSGLGTFLMGRPEGRIFFWLHSVTGLAIVGLLFWKFRRVHRRVSEPRRWQWATAVSVLVAISALLTIGIGLIWAIGQRPVNYPNGMILHTTFAIILFLAMLWHLWLRYKPLRLRDFEGRRSAMHFLGLFAVGSAIWGTQEVGNRLLKTPGASRRFTGSREAGKGSGNDAFPVTMWMFDRPAPVDRQTWQLSVTGAVETPFSIGYTNLNDFDLIEAEATLDCTGGWYSTQQWQGLSVGALLDQATVSATATMVSFRSVTGYRWSVPLAEARAALLATHVGGERLNHGHGGPLRLVLPGRRGFQWVKWVTEIELLTKADLGQWGVIFVSGLGDE